MGMALEALHQPVINGYLIAGSIVGPGGLQLIKVGWTADSRAHESVLILACNALFISPHDRTENQRQETMHISEAGDTLLYCGAVEPEF